MHILTHEEGDVTYLHYGFFENESDSIARAQERSTEMLLARLPPPPARLLDVGIGVGTTLSRLTRLGYQALGITPDEKQIALVRERFGDAVRVDCIRFEDVPAAPYDAVVFQESSQYIDSEALFAKAAELTSTVIVLDEFALEPIDKVGALHQYSAFIEAARRHGFEIAEELDVSEQAAPTVDYFIARLPRWRERLIADLGLTDQQVDDLIESGRHYRDLYRRGVYGYRVLTLSASGRRRSSGT